MKIGILTRHNYPNYGSLLQAVALSQFLKENLSGSTVNVIDYVPKYDSLLRLPISGLKQSRLNSSLFGRLLYLLVQAPVLGLASVRFRKHQKRLLPLTEKMDCMEAVLEKVEAYDVVISGSDQVWNRIHGSLDSVYYQKNFPERVSRFSYAASFGGDGLDIATDFPWILDQIKSFDFVSVRESSAIDWVRGISSGAQVDVDPVLLPHKSFWSNFCQSIPQKDRKFILVYQLHSTPEFDDFLTKIQEDLGLPVLRVSIDLKMIKKRGRLRYLVSPERFISFFRDASLIVTDSFHGTVFGHIFEKEVQVVLPEHNSRRIIDFTHLAGSSSIRVLNDYDNAASAVEKKLDRLQEQSRDELLRAIVNVSHQ